MMGGLRNDILISIIMPTYNRRHIIEKAIQSVIEQTYKNWELIIVDDASTDGTEELVKRISDSRIIYIKNEKNRGANYARNCGCALAKGEYLAFLDSDNYWTFDKLEKQIYVLANSEDNVAFAFCSVKIADEKIRIVPKLDFDIHELRSTLYRKNVVDTNTVMMRKRVFDEVGGFDEEMPRLQDWELFFRTIVVYQYTAKFIPEVMACGVIQPDSIGRDNRKFQDALLLFLEKHINYFKSDDVIYIIQTLWNNVQIYGYQQKVMETIHKKKHLEIAWKLMAQIDSQTKYYETLFLWKEKMESNRERTIFSDFMKLDHAIIGLYGLGRWGEAVYEEMRNVGIEISYGIDRQVKNFHRLTVVTPDKIPENVDIIIVSVFQHYLDIFNTLSQYYKGKIISILDIIEKV